MADTTVGINRVDTRDSNRSNEKVEKRSVASKPKVASTNRAARAASEQSTQSQAKCDISQMQHPSSVSNSSISGIQRINSPLWESRFRHIFTGYQFGYKCWVWSPCSTNLN